MIDNSKNQEAEKTKRSQKISFSQDTTGHHYIKVNGVELDIHIPSLNDDERIEILDGLGSLLHSIACYMRR